MLFITQLPVPETIVFVREIAFFLNKTGQRIMIPIHILHKYQLIHVGVSVSVTQILVIVAIKHVVLGLLCPVLLVEGLDLLVLVIEWIFLFYLDVDSFMVVLGFSVGVLLVGEGHLAALTTTAFGTEG